MTDSLPYCMDRFIEWHIKMYNVFLLKYSSALACIYRFINDRFLLY